MMKTRQRQDAHSLDIKLQYFTEALKTVYIHICHFSQEEIYCNLDS